MTYCTGGIRCVKINAFLEQKLGFSNVNRLQGGIISYTRELELEDKIENADTNNYISLLSKSQNERNVEKSKFKGVNYVFDDRMGARVTSGNRSAYIIFYYDFIFIDVNQDVLTQCETCGDTCDAFTNCQSSPCNVSSICMYVWICVYMYALFMYAKCI